MANTMISALPAGAPAQSTDALPIARSGANYKLLVSDLSAALVGGLTVTPSTGTLTVPNGTVATLQGTDTYVGRATTDTLTNKTFDTAGTGNVFKINGVAISAVTGTGNNVLSTSPSLTTPNIGAASGTSLALTGKIGTYNNVSTAGNGVPAEVNQILTFNQTANYNSGSAKTLFTPTASGMWRICAVEATQNTPTGATLPSLTVAWTDIAGIARTFVLIPTASTSSSATMNQASMVIYSNGSTAVTVTSASYAAGSGTALQYSLGVTAEQL